MKPLIEPLIVCLTLLTLTLPLRAQDVPEKTSSPAEPQTAAQWNALRVQGQQMQARAGQLRTEAQQAYAAAERDCWKKFLVSACLEDARQAQRDAQREAKRLEVEAGRIERRLAEHERRERVARKQAKKQADLAQREQRRAGTTK